MTNLSEREKETLKLPPQERERLVLAMWDSLEGVAAVDPEDVEIALSRDAEIEAGAVQLISHSEFKRRVQAAADDGCVSSVNGCRSQYGHKSI